VAVPAAVVLAGAGLGVASELVAYDWNDIRHWLPDLLTGLACIVAGAWSLRRRPATGVLLASSGALWFLGNIWPALLYAHRGSLVHLFVTYPGWRPWATAQRAAVAAGYAISVTSLWSSDIAGPILAGSVLALTGWELGQAHGRARRDRRTAFEASAVFAAAIAVGSVVRAIEPSGDAVEPMVVVYEITIVWIAGFMAARLRPSESAAVTDLVVELGERRSGELRSALATTLGDPTLEVGYWTPVAGVYVDVVGAVLQLPTVDAADRAATFVEREGTPFAVLIHDAGVLDDPALVDAVATATRLTATNAALAGEVSARVADVAASRRRLLVAADDERRRLAARLHADIERQVVELNATVVAIAAHCHGTDAAQHLRRAADHLGQSVVDLRQLASGLHPPELDAGLGSAIRVLAQRSPVPVELALRGSSEAAGEIAVAAYYVCAEALTNIAKHAGATRADIELTTESKCLRVIIADDGCGGAEPSAGGGLRGLADRVEALGGSLSVSSPLTGGTRLVAELPLGHQHSSEE
jgi:signal transduction histidine kinase